MIPLRLTAVVAPALLPAAIAHATSPALDLPGVVPACVATFTPFMVTALTYDFVGSTVTTEGNSKPRERVMMRGHATALGDKVRIDVNAAGAADPFMRGQYVLVFENGRRIVWVDPVARQYREMTPRAMAGGLDVMTNGSNGTIMMEASNVSIDAEKVGAGPTIQGHSTVHYRLHQRMDMRTTVFYTTLVTHDESTTDYYYATDVPALVNPFLSGTTDLPEKQVILGEDYTRQLRAAMNKLYHGSAPLLTVVNAKSTDERGHSRATVTTTEVTRLQQRDVNTSVFEIPSDYTRMNGPLFTTDAPPDVPDLMGGGTMGGPWTGMSGVAPRGRGALGLSPYSLAPTY